mmetsp:Transcript_97793/g.245037  ORF Transcript_97793/g.245037 Transcript_97793/m.245037 type:complete len:224 (-) Transcript_97793:164-835(-)
MLCQVCVLGVRADREHADQRAFRRALRATLPERGELVKTRERLILASITSGMYPHKSIVGARGQECSGACPAAQQLLGAACEGEVWAPRAAGSELKQHHDGLHRGRCRAAGGLQELQDIPSPRPGATRGAFVARTFRNVLEALVINRCCHARHRCRGVVQRCGCCSCCAADDSCCRARGCCNGRQRLLKIAQRSIEVLAHNEALHEIRQGLRGGCLSPGRQTP